uniref:YEATS domain-containing protein n=1 Tax=Glossina brevipalpis TaxID=37001 RepID=A0A1A9WFY5_9MUSC
MASYDKASPQKRKHKEEYHDPYYYANSEDVQESTFKNEEVASKRRREDAEDVIGDDQRLQRVCIIIEREFQNEIHFKQQQLQEIDDRLSKAKQLLERLRYNIVAEYYSKQELPLTAIDAAGMRDKNTQFQRGQKTLQTQLHPSVKRIIGKKPKEPGELGRSCSRRMAAQSAKESIRIRSQVQKREERKLQQMIREQGIVIDHSKEDSMNNYTDVKQLLSSAQQSLARVITNGTITPSCSSMRENGTLMDVGKGNALNAARLNNKIKHLIVVGNISKYIGDETEQDRKPTSHNLTHKWLVYVQAKESRTPLENYIKKVRFFLHQSYRPNDVVDVRFPPFQVARRGWGEFPIRVQLFFHASYYQKPVQLLHNIVLDKTLSGLQTLGAETLMEVWLRDTGQNEVMKKDGSLKIQVESKQDVIHKTEELVDDNLLDFLNKIEATPSGVCADIEKIQPTVVVTEPLICKLKSPDSKKLEATICNKQLGDDLEQFKRDIPQKDSNVTSLLQNPHKLLYDMKSISHSKISTTAISNIVTTEATPPSAVNSELITKPMTPIPGLSQPSNELSSRTPPLTTTATSTCSLAPVVSNKQIRSPMTAATSVASIVKCAVLPIMSTKSNVNTGMIKPVPLTTTNSAGSKQIFQKKLVQLVDSTGKVKYLHMLVATSSPAANPIRINNNKGTSNASTKVNSTVTNIKQTLKPTNGLVSNILTTKPNIVKIKLDELQSKPKVITFSTSRNASTTTTFTTTTTPLSSCLTLSNVLKTDSNPSSAIATSTNGMSSPNAAEKSVNGMYSKNVVFHKEGKLCIIDPLQMKLKQQQKKQISLLKPQISWLKHKQEQIQRTASALQASIADDHSYVPFSLNTELVFPRIHQGLRQSRENCTTALQFKQLQRQKLENNFLKQNFINMRGAVEYLLRRLQLIANKYIVEAKAFPFVSQTAQEFQLLTAFKQRSCEWLRAKAIANLIRQHKDLQKLEKASKATFWSTREIAEFARQYAYTPIIKSLPPATQSKQEGSFQFAALVQSELKQEPSNLSLTTLSDRLKIDKWMERISQQLGTHDVPDKLEIVNVDRLEINNFKKHSNKISDNCLPKRIANSDLVFTSPKELENECQLVSYISKELRLNISPEEVETKVWLPAAQTILGHCLRIFLEKLLRQSIATKMQKETVTATIELFATDIVKMLCKNGGVGNEFDFLTDKNFGIVLSDRFKLNEFKQENC